MKNTTKNIKFVPTYACKLGKGKFVGPYWECAACGHRTHSEKRPSVAGCPKSLDGYHMWEEQ